jgi:hypothetical protein
MGKSICGGMQSMVFLDIWMRWRKEHGKSMHYTVVFQDTKMWSLGV